MFAFLFISPFSLNLYTHVTFPVIILNSPRKSYQKCFAAEFIVKVLISKVQDDIHFLSKSESVEVGS